MNFQKFHFCRLCWPNMFFTMLFHFLLFRYILYVYILLDKVRWRNWLARRSSEPKVIGSNPTMSNEIFNTVREWNLSNYSYGKCVQKYFFKEIVASLSKILF